MKAKKNSKDPKRFEEVKKMKPQRIIDSSSLHHISLDQHISQKFCKISGSVFVQKANLSSPLAKIYLDKFCNNLYFVSKCTTSFKQAS